jgi:Queuine tRNA-ribosyltransferase
LKLLILTSCTGEKAVDHPDQLTLEDFQKGSVHLGRRELGLQSLLRTAGEIYTGEQHLRLMRGVGAYRTAASGSGGEIELHVLSAGYGVIPESRVVAPYETTFATMKTKELREWADALKVPEDFRKTVAGQYDLGLILLGDNYLQACALDASIKFGGPTLLLCGTGMAKKLPTLKHVRVVPISNPEAKRFSCGLVGLKGELAARLLKGIGDDPAVLNRLMDPKFDLLAWLEKQPGAGKSVAQAEAKTVKKSVKKKVVKDNEVSVSKAPMVAKPNVDKVIHIPKSWWEKPHKQKLRYFIPEWDDLVDPDYDFLNDMHSGGRSNWANEVYAHQMYPEPNYDGLLMSRAVAEKSKGKTERINEMGVHRMLRVPRDFPIMGDCGAFDYIMEDVPPYTTADVLDYYTRLDFDFGVSVDHLIVTATEHQKKERFELTIQNAEDFLKEHRKAKLKWEPIGAVQGWDPKSYAKAAAKYVKMGYKYIGLGGLVRSSTASILELMQAVREVVPSDMNIHLFGLARLNAMKQLADLGVTSVDSASALRQAWFGAKDNYWSLTGQHYRAIRIPKAERSFRAKNIVSDGRASGNYVEQAEKRSIEALRMYDQGKISVDEVIKILEDFDHLITPDRPTFMEQYRKTLEDMPWKKCPCAICQKDGVEVIIFRGNDRNRRRGFHNTFVFHQMFQAILNGTMQPPAKARGSHILHPELDLGI